jgi:hypothetical protein
MYLVQWRIGSLVQVKLCLTVLYNSEMQLFVPGVAGGGVMLMLLLYFCTQNYACQACRYFSRVFVTPLCISFRGPQEIRPAGQQLLTVLQFFTLELCYKCVGDEEVFHSIMILFCVKNLVKLPTLTCLEFQLYG